MKDLLDLDDPQSNAPVTRPAGLESRGVEAQEEILLNEVDFVENATFRGRAWYKLLDAPSLTLDVTV